MRRLADRSLHWLSNSAVERRNIMWRIAGGLIGGVGGVFCFGPVQQGYLLKVGFSDPNLGQLAFVGSIAPAVGLFVFMGVADRFKRRIPTVATLALLGVTTPLALCLLSLLPVGRVSVGLVLWTMAAVVAVHQPLASLGTMVRTGVTQRTLRVGIRGRVTSIGGLVGGLGGMAAGVAAGRALLRYGYPRGYTLCFAVGAGLLLIGSLTIWKLTELPELDGPVRVGSASPFAAMLDVLKVRKFRVLIAPNALRGLVGAVGVFLVSIGTKRVGLPLAYAGYMVTVMKAAEMTAVIGLGWPVDRWGPGAVIMAGNLLSAFGVVGLILAPSPDLFLAACAVYGVGGTLMGYAVPLGIYEVAPHGLAGAFNGARLMLMGGVGAFAALLIGYLLKSAGSPVVLTGAAVGHLVTGGLYWYGFRRKGAIE